MNRKLLTFIVSLLFFITHAMAVDVPPMPPMMTKKMNDPKPNAKHKDKLSSISDCSTLPPMIIFLPPPMETSLISCRNQYYKPSKKDASEKLSKYYKKPINVTKVSVVSNFREVYKISIKNKKTTYVRYCNKDLNSCLQ